jgi:hypothetical protein
MLFGDHSCDEAAETFQKYRLDRGLASVSPHTERNGEAR